MEFNSYLMKCHKDDVIAFGNKLIKWGNFLDILQSVFSVAEIRHSQVARAINEKFKSLDIELHAGAIILPAGMRCEILKIGSSGWKTGRMKIKVTLEFIPDEPEIEELPANNQSEIPEPESPLDDLRRMMNENMNGTST